MADLHDFLAAGLSYRQLDYWTTKGYLHAEEANPGSGYVRRWKSGEVEVARAMASLVAGGLSVERAHEIARGDPRVANAAVKLIGGAP